MVTPRPSGYWRTAGELGTLGLSFVLVWVGIKMIVSHAWVTIPTVLSLGIVVAIITASVVASLLATRSRPDEAAADAAAEEAGDAVGQREDAHD